MVEPDGKAVEVCKSILGKIAKEIKFTWEVTTVVDYLPRQVKEKGQFELIHFIHSLFSFGDNETRLPLYVNELLAPSGILAICLGGNDNFWGKIDDRFSDRLNYMTRNPAIICWKIIKSVQIDTNTNWRVIITVIIIIMSMVMRIISIKSNCKLSRLRNGNAKILHHQRKLMSQRLFSENHIAF